MNKRGVVVELGAVIMILLTTIGVIVTLSSSRQLYVGDSGSGLFVDYYQCKEYANHITEENLVVFSSREDAAQQFKPKEGCV